MNPKSLVRLSNWIGLVSIILLVYWVFTFIAITVFDLKVFRENITQSFYWSVLGILALMFGALMINIMFNLTRIAERQTDEQLTDGIIQSRTVTIFFLVSLPVIFALLFLGDYLSSRKKEEMLVNSASFLLRDNPAKAEILLDYRFDERWLRDTDSILDVYSKADKNFPNIALIIADTIEGSNVFLRFSEFYRPPNDTTHLRKIDYMLATTEEERKYLTSVFLENSDKVRFTADDGQYELFFPYRKGRKKIVLHFSDYQRYGKLGS